MAKVSKLSLFPCLLKYESEETTLEEIIILIRRRRWVHEITAYRTALSEGRTDEAARLKRLLPGFTPSGVFRGGHRDDQVICYSQLVGLDFDHVKDLPALILLFRMMPTTAALFVSPGGGGVKVFVYVDSPVEHHRRAFEVVALHYEEVAGMVSDRKCRNVGRCCFVSDDPEAYYNPEAEVFHVAVTMPADASSGNGRQDVDAFLDWWLSRNPMIEGSRNQNVYNLGCEANRRGFSEAETARSCVFRMQSASFSAPEIEQALRSAYQSHAAESGTKSFAKGHERTKRTSAIFPGEEPEKEEPEEEGEELRKQTPYLPEEALEALPGVIREAIGRYTDRRERDMAALAVCTVLSACVPGVFGYYRRRRVTPHIYTIEVAPAANGKGCIDEMRHLVDHYATLIKSESEREEKAHLQALEEWEQKKQDAHRRHETVDLSEEPRPARTRHLIVPSQVTKAKLLVHLRDNGEVGLLIVDSEIDTLLSATKLDYGQFDDLLRKSFHHEPVASSRKGDNEMINIENPQVALLLGGTPGQFTRLITDAENGLMSRLLLYTCRSAAVWQDVSPGMAGRDYEKHLADLSSRVMDMALRLRGKSLQVGPSKSQWNLLNNRFSALLRESDLFGGEEFLSVVKRYGLITFRLCMLFTALEVAAEGDDIPGLRTCSDSHFEAAFSIIRTCLEHSRLLMTQLRRAEDQPELTTPLKFRSIFDVLPEQFTLPEVYRLADGSGLTERHLRQLVKCLIPLYISRVTHGVYRKDTPGVV
ncbi:MAG: DUF3987 domain-containing protein [Parabacteroides sp.]|nr:DUF3987 domain-containing protein [Parabacteroides sp.]